MRSSKNLAPLFGRKCIIHKIVEQPLVDSHFFVAARTNFCWMWCGVNQPLIIEEAMIRSSFSCGIFATSLFLGACAKLPALEEATGGIPVTDIVLRTKCELSDAFVGPQDIERADMAWMRDWTAQIDLTLEVLDTATLAPGVSLTQPLRNAYGVAAGPTSISTAGVLGTSLGSISQSFAIAGGVSVNGQATRMETLGFTVSLAELKRFRKRPDIAQLCAISDEMDLRGRLGLKEWIADALQPVKQRLLLAGYHPAPLSGGGAKPSSPPKGSTTAPAGAGASSLLATKVEAIIEEKACPAAQTQKYVEIARTNTKAAQSNLQDSSLDKIKERIATSVASQTPQLASASSDFETSVKGLKAKLDQSKQFTAVLDPFVARQFNAAAAGASNISSKIKSESKTVEDNLTHASASASAAVQTVETVQGDLKDVDAKLNKANAMTCEQLQSLDQESENIKENSMKAKIFAKNAQDDITMASTGIKFIKAASQAISTFADSLKTIDPPISTIGQSIQFVLNYGGNVTPTWTFVRFKGPNNPFFSTSGTRTHMLNITLGPTAPTSSGANTALAQSQLYMLLNNRLPSLPQ